MVLCNVQGAEKSEQKKAFECVEHIYYTRDRCGKDGLQTGIIEQKFLNCVMRFVLFTMFIGFFGL